MAPGGREADLELRGPGGRTQMVEVKASGASRFVELKPRDLVRDGFIWADFGQRYQLGYGPIDLHVLRQPGAYQAPYTKLTLDRFLADAREVPGYELLTIDSLEDYLGTGAPGPAD